MELADLKGLLPVRFAAVRAATDALVAPLSDEDCCAQSMPDASPVKWHLAHTTWFLETFVLEPNERGFKPFDAAFRMLFNSYYEAVGARHPRPKRGLLTRPSLSVVRAYRQAVDERMHRLLERDVPASVRDLVALGLQHEQQHQELILTDVKHLLSANPTWPAYRSDLAPHRRAAMPLAAADASRDAAEASTAMGRSVRWVRFDGGVVHAGAVGNGFAFDNELPRHRCFLEPYALADRLVTNADYLAFVEDGGYRHPRWWLSEGWDWVQREQAACPQYWHAAGGSWHQFTLTGLVALDPAEPAAHLSYFEADAYARWAGARLPTEFEWEHAAALLPVDGNFVESQRLHPSPAADDASGGLRQMFGDLWEWTSSSYAPYPGFRIAPGAVGEYNGKFMVNQYVLRGGSCATPRDHVRASYRNFFPTYARWQFSGVRLARSEQ